MGEGTAIAYIHGDAPTSPFHASLVNLLIHDANTTQRVTRYGGVIDFQSSPRIVAARNEVVWNFLQADELAHTDWLLMIDTDMQFEFDVLDKMHKIASAEQVPILGGLCFAGGRGKKPPYPTIYELGRNEFGPTAKPVEDYPDDALMKVGATGAAFLLVHRKALLEFLLPAPKGFGTMPGFVSPTGEENVANPWPWFGDTLQGQNEIGEDIMFCLRAQALGLPVHVHTGIKVGHVKTWTITDKDFRREQARKAKLKADLKLPPVAAR